MSRLQPKSAAVLGGAALLAMLGISTDAEAAKKKPVTRNSIPYMQANSLRSYQLHNSYNYAPWAFSTVDLRRVGGGQAAKSPRLDGRTVG